MTDRPFSLRTVFWLMISIGLGFGLSSFFRSPFAALPFAYYDNAETLYHALTILEGRVPYREDYNHHFVGYVLPYVAAAKLWGFSPNLIAQFFFVTQAITAGLIYLALILFFPPLYALLGALLAIAAREPWTIGYFIQYELNVGFTAVLLACLYGAKRRSRAWIFIAAVIAGLCFVMDQRALFALALPLIALPLVDWRGWIRSGIEGSALVVAFLIPPAAALAYLWSQQALGPFIEQTFVFPMIYRSGSQGLIQRIADGFWLQRYLFTSSPILFAFALVGYYQLLRTAALDEPARCARLMLVLAAPIYFLIPFFGGRDFDYYTVTWLPYLGILAIFSLELFTTLPTKLISGLALGLSLALPIYSTYQLKAELGTRELDDGAAEVVAFLKQNSGTAESVFVWGYRLDLYLHLNRPSPYPFSNLILVHPDQGVQFQPDRARHIYPKYEREFLNLLRRKPPEWVVFASRADLPEFDSPSYRAVRALTDRGYTLENSLQKKDFRGVNIIWEIYRRTASAHSLP